MPLSRTFRIVSSFLATAACAALLAGCEGEGGSTPSEYRAFAPLSHEALESMRAKDTDKNLPMLIRAYKKEAQLEIWKQNRAGKYVMFKTYPMCRWSGQLGPKVNEGDRQVPEGFYTITPGQMNPNSHYYLSFNVGYPNAYDRANGHTGGSIMVHGICSSAGCFSMTDKQIEEIYAVARESFAGGQHAIQMQSYPFRMTADNLAKLRLDPNMAFWRELKKGSDYFEVSKLETPVGVCNKHYAFGTPKTGRFDAFSACPPLQDEPEIRSAVAAKEQSDEHQVADLVAKGIKPVKIVYADGGQNEEFKTQRIAEVSRPDALAAGATEIALDESPKSKPVAVQLAAYKAGVKAGSGRSGAPAGKPSETAQAGTTTVAANTSLVPATFAAAPSAYASETPKAETPGFFKNLIGFGTGPTAEAVPAIQQQPVAQTVVADRTAPALSGKAGGAATKAAPVTLAAAVPVVVPAPSVSPAPVAAPPADGKTDTGGFFNHLLSFGSNATPDATPVAVPAQPAAAEAAPALAGKKVAARRGPKTPVKPAEPTAAPKPAQQASIRLPKEIVGSLTALPSGASAYATIDR